MSFIEVSSGVRERDVPLIMGQVLSLVGVALGVCALATYLGRDLAFGTARIFSFAGLGLLIAQSFVAPLRRGGLGVFWLGLIAMAIGYGLGPFIAYYVDTNLSAVTSAVGLTALTVVGMGAAGFAWSKDLKGWMKPCPTSSSARSSSPSGSLIFGGLGSLSPVISIIILVASAALILVDFNYVRKHATEDDVIWLATGIFVSIINIFISLLSLFGNR